MPKFSFLMYAVLAAVIFIGLCPGARAAIGQHEDPNTLYGIGAVLISNGSYPTITGIVPGGAAEKDGHLNANDRITGVAQGDAPFVDCTGLKLANVADMVRGKKGTTVRLQVIPAGAADPSKREVIPLVRAEIKTKPSAPVGTTAQVSSLSPDTQTKLDDAVKKIADATRKCSQRTWKKRSAAVVQVTASRRSRKAALENASPKAVDQCLAKICRQLSAIHYGPNSRGSGRTIGLSSARSTATPIPTRIVQTQSGIWPADQPAWKDALKQTLTPQQAAAWDAAEAKRKQAVEAQIGDFSKRVAQFAIAQSKTAMNAKTDRIQTALSLPKDRLDKLNAAAQSMLDQFGAGHRHPRRKSIARHGRRRAQAGYQRAPGLL